MRLAPLTVFVLMTLLLLTGCAQNEPSGADQTSYKPAPQGRCH